MKQILALIILLLSTTQAHALDRQTYCLAQNIYFEARSEPIAGRFAVAGVTLNRVKSKHFPNTICKVVWQRKQFSWTHDGKSDKPKEKRAWQRAIVVAKAAEQWYKTGEDFSDGALYYHACYKKPAWAKHFKRLERIGKHIFYR